MLADPRRSCIVLLNVTRSALANAADVFAERRRASLPLLAICRDVLDVPQIAIGEYEQALLSNEVAASIEHPDVDILSMWRDPQFVKRLVQSDIGTIFLGGAFLEEEVLIAALEGARHGYDVRLLSELSVARHEADRSLVLARLAHHGIVVTTVRQALLEWAVRLGDPTVSRKIQELP